MAPDTTRATPLVTITGCERRPPRPSRERPIVRICGEGEDGPEQDADPDRNDDRKDRECPQNGEDAERARLLGREAELRVTGPLVRRVRLELRGIDRFLAHRFQAFHIACRAWRTRPCAPCRRALPRSKGRADGASEHDRAAGIERRRRGGRRDELHRFARLERHDPRRIARSHGMALE